MPSTEEARGEADKLQSAPGVNLVREVLELFTVLHKPFKDASLQDQIVGGGGACFAHKARHNVLTVFMARMTRCH